MKVKILKQYSAPSKKPIRSIDISSDNKLLAVGQSLGKTDAPTLSLLDFKTGKVIETIEKTTDTSESVIKVFFHPQKNFLIYFIQTGAKFELRTYDIDNKEKKTLLKTSEVITHHTLSIDNKGKYLTAILTSKTLQIIDAENFKVIKELKLQIKMKPDYLAPICSKISHNGKLIAISGIEEGKIYIYETATLKIMKILELHSSLKNINQLEFDKDDKYLIGLIAVAKGMPIWNFKTGKRHLEDFYNEDRTSIVSINASPTLDIIATGYFTSSCVIFNLLKDEVIYRDREYHKGTISDIKFSQDGSFLISSGNDANIVVRQIK
jgi:WD40 repeat protein